MAAPTAPPRGRAQALAALGESLKRLLGTARRVRGQDTHRPGTLSHAQYLVLFELLAGELPAGELAAVTGVSPASTTQMLDRLADAGLVARVRSEEDRRIVASRLTEAGRAACEERRAAVEPLWREMLGEFTVAELTTAAAVCDRMTEVFARLGCGHERP
jgi:DNA-binding MarR family transcriptional regulator